MKKFLLDFKSFAVRGNVLDMAVGVIIGGAFSKIVSSVVGDILMPLLSVLVGGFNLSGLQIELAVSGGRPPVIFAYGNFLQSFLDFLIIAFCIFLFTKLLSRMRLKKEEEAAAQQKPAKTELLLTEIRDLLKTGGER